MPYEAKRVPLYTPAGNREASDLKDARLVNCWVEKDSAGRVWVQKRPAIVRQHSFTPAPGRGVYEWDGTIYAIFGGTLYAGNLETNFVPVGSVSNFANSPPYHFVTTLGAVHKLYFNNGAFNSSFVYTIGGGVQLIGDGNYPGNIVGVFLAVGGAYLDGVIYVGNSVGAGIYGSGINDPFTWPADNFILAQIEPDNIVFVKKHLVYIVVAKQWTTEVFHDAGNAAGSPLAPDQGLKMNFGCLYAQSVQDLGGDLMWVATSRETGPSVVHLSNLRAQIVSTPAIERQLTGFALFPQTTVTSWSGKVGGHRLYAITLPTKTLVYDLTVGLWYEWLTAGGNPFPIAASTTDDTFQRLILQNKTDGDLYTLEMGTYRDDDGIFPVDIYTPNWDDSVRVKKQVSYTELIGDQVPGSICTVAVSDDDYQTWSDPRVVDRGMERQILSNGGTFRRRAFWVHHHEDKAFRVQALELMVAHGPI